MFLSLNNTAFWCCDCVLPWLLSQDCAIGGLSCFRYAGGVLLMFAWLMPLCASLWLLIAQYVTENQLHDRHVWLCVLLWVVSACSPGSGRLTSDSVAPSHPTVVECQPTWDLLWVWRQRAMFNVQPKCCQTELPYTRTLTPAVISLSQQQQWGFGSALPSQPRDFHMTALMFWVLLYLHFNTFFTSERIWNSRWPPLDLLGLCCKRNPESVQFLTVPLFAYCVAAAPRGTHSAFSNKLQSWATAQIVIQPHPKPYLPSSLASAWHLQTQSSF